MSRSQAPVVRRRLGRLAAVFATALAAGTLSGAAFAQAAFPSRPVTLVVPFAAGGPTDVVARTLGQAMTRHLGQTVVVENTVGAGGTIAVNRVARAQPDGYTVLIHHNGMATAVGLYRKLTFNPLTDFEYIGQVADVPMTLLAKKTMPANTLSELIAYLKANKDKVTVANAGLGAVSHLCGMLFMSAIQTELTTVPYKGTAPAMTDLLGGQVDVLCDQTTQTLPQIKAGNVKLYGVTCPSASRRCRPRRPWPSRACPASRWWSGTASMRPRARPKPPPRRSRRRCRRR